MNMMEVDPSSSPVEENIIGENQGDNSNSTPGSSEQVTESGTPLDEYSDLWLEFKCVFCNQDLKNINRPKLLQCLHTACENCLATESNGETSGASSSASDNKQLSCPICAQEININDVVDHLFLVEYAQNSESLPEESSFPCTSCEEGVEGTAFCQECQEWLCHDCVNAHHRVRVTKDHTVRPKEEMEGDTVAARNQKYLLCQVHSHEQLKLYCETCDKLTCRDCQLSTHKEHKYQFITKACEEEKNHILDHLTKIKEKQNHIETATSSLNKRNEEILERERVLSQEIKTFAVKFITDINKRGKALLHDLDKVCSDKKTEVNSRTQELRAISERLKHCQKFAEAAINLGSETALVYSKKPIMNQLRRILRHRCEVPHPNQVVDITFNYETNFLTQYISSLGQIKVDGMPIPGAAANTNLMLPMPGSASQSSPIQRAGKVISMPSAPQPIPQQPRMQMQQQQRMALQMQNQITHQQPQMRAQSNMMLPYGQPQVTSSTDLARNHNAPQMRQQMVNSKQVAFNRNNLQQQRSNIVQQQTQQQNFNMQQQQQQQQQANATFQQRQMAQQHQTPPQQQQQMRQHPQVQQQQVQQQQQQHQSQPQQQQNYNSTPRLPMPLIQNKNISVTAVASPTGPSPSKQRAIAPRNLNNQTTPPRQQQQRAGGPQVIVLDDQPNQKTPTMSNTNRLSHFPNIAATLASHPGLQIQPTNNNNSYSKF